MKRIVCMILGIGLLLSGCTSPAVDEPQSTPAATAQTENTTETIEALPEQEAMYAVSLPAISENSYADDGTVIFSYTRQSMALFLPDPDVAHMVIEDFRTRVESATDTVNILLDSAKANYTSSANWTPYLYSITYSPMRMDQGVLSLFGNSVTYSGTSHPDRLCVSASYDLVTGDVLTLGSIMSAEASTDDFCALVLDQLEKIRDEKYLYEGYENTVEQRFSKDESQDQDWYFSTNGLCFYFVPYEIAPYSSGVITVEIPYTELTGLIYDGYFPAERESASGTVYSIVSDETTASRFTQIAELVLDADGQMAFLYTNGAVWDLKIEYGAWDTTSTVFTPVYTALFSGSLTPGDAIMLQSNELTTLRLTYSTGTEIVTQHFTQTEQGLMLIT